MVWAGMVCQPTPERPEYHQGIGGIKPIVRHEGREHEITARREELFKSIKREGRKPKILTSV